MNDATPNHQITPARVTSLKRRSDFLRLRSGKRHHSPNFILQTLPMQLDAREAGNARVGYTVTTKTGNSVERSRIKRRLREAVRAVFPRKSRASHDYAIIAKRSVLSADFSTMLREVEIALDRLHGKRANGDGRRGRAKPKPQNRSDKPGQD